MRIWAQLKAPNRPQLRKIGMKHKGEAATMLRKNIRAPEEKTSAKTARKTAVNTPGKSAGKTRAAFPANLAVKKAMARDAGPVCHVRFPYFLKMMRSSSSTSRQDCSLCRSKAPMSPLLYLC